jgi:hypothetical protein
VAGRRIDPLARSAILKKGNRGRVVASEGILYYADAPRYFAQAERSVASLRRVMPEVHVTLATTLADVEVDGFDSIRQLEVAPDDHTRIGKIRAIATAPYDKVIYVDTDTIFAGDVGSIFAALDDFGLAASHAPIRRSPVGAWDASLPECFTGLNGGVLGLNLTDPDTAAFVAAWEDAYRDTSDVTRQDQPSFNRLLYRSRVRFLVLPPEYNFRAEFSNQSKGANMGVKVIHSHAVNEMDRERTDDLIRKLSDDRFATFLRDEDDIAVQFTKMPTVAAMPQVARSLSDARLAAALRASHMWDRAREGRNLRNEVFDILSEDAGLKVLQIGNPVAPILDLINRASAEAAICVTDQSWIERLETGITSPSARIVEAAFAVENGDVEVVRRADDVPPGEVIDPATGIEGLLQRLFPSRRPDWVRTRRPARVWPELYALAGIDDPQVVALATAGRDREAVEACLAAIDTGDLPTPKYIQVESRKIPQRSRRAVRKALRDAGFWVLDQGGSGIMAVHPVALGLVSR